MFGFNSAKHDLKLFKAFLLPILVNARDNEPNFITKSNQFISFNFGGIQQLDMMIDQGGATSLDSFLKAILISETEKIFPLKLV